MGEESCEVHPEDDNAISEKNKKRIVKSRAQVQALEKFYSEHKYPSESMKLQVAESIGLTEKQVSGWFCHRRLKDKKLMNGENYASLRQDRSGGVIQDRGSGHRQDSCGSTKQGDDKNLDAREVESGRLTSKEISAAELTYEDNSHHVGNYHRTNDASSGSTSSLRNIPPSYQNEDPSDTVTSNYLKPKFPADLKGVTIRRGPSGYLKVKGRPENPAIAAVKRQLGKYYREDGPPLGVEFDTLPPGAFESSMQDPVKDYHTGEYVCGSPNFPNVRQNSQLCKGSEYLPNMASFSCDIDRTNFKARSGSDIPDSYTYQNPRIRTSFSNSCSYYPRSNSSLEFTKSPVTEISGIRSRENEYGLRHKPAVEVMTMDTVQSYSNLQASGGKLREEGAEFRARKFNDGSTRVALVEKPENDNSSLTAKRNKYHSSMNKRLRREVIKDGKFCDDQWIQNKHRVKIPLKDDIIARKRIREEFPHQDPLKATLMEDNLPHNYQVIRSSREMPSSFSEDEENGGTSSSMG